MLKQRQCGGWCASWCHHGAVGENSTFMGPSFVSLGKRDRDHVLADWDEGPRVQPANPTHCVSFTDSREGEELGAWGTTRVGGGKGEKLGVLDRVRREKSPKSWVRWRTMLFRGI